MNIHYDITSGQIVSYGWGAEHGDGFDTSPYPGCRVLLIEDRAIDPATQRVDPITLEIVAREPDPEPDPLPQIKVAVARELADTDRFMLPDFPISDADRVAWTAYRKAMRDASKGVETGAAMVAGIPARPDGNDVFGRFR